MIDFKQALAYLKENGVTPHELFTASGLSAGSLTLVFKGDTKNPRRKTKQVIIDYAEKLMKQRGENIEGESVDNYNPDILDKNDKDFIQKLALTVREYKVELMQERSFSDLIYIEALKMALLAKEGEVINVEKLVELTHQKE